MNKLGLFSAKVVLPCLLISGASVAAEANSEQYASLHKQLSIMSDIIKSSASDKSSKRGSRINSIESTYLRGQGVVFTISAAANNRRWGSYNFSFAMPELPPLPPMPDLPVAPIAPEANDDFEQHFDININKTVSRALESAADGYERAVEIFEHNRDKTRELREQQRDLAYRLRDVEREKRDINYQLSRATDERKTELQQELKQLEEQEKSLRVEKRKMTQLTSQYANEQKQQQAKRNEERVSYYQQLTQTLTETLCLYGNGLKALPKNEHVSVIVKSAGEKLERRYKDSILVFNKQDIASCSADKISAKKLLSKGQAYQF
ncbi:MAG: hypothetical protein ACPG52_07095 [Cognaticolwellia sp.]